VVNVILKSLLAAALIGIGWFEFGQDLSVREIGQEAVDIFDSRPVHSVLILGNSRTYGNDMPQMIRRIADSARNNEKYEVVTVALPGASFESLSQDPRVRRLLAEPFDDVVLQGESRGQSSPELSEAFQRYGAALAAMARSRHRPLLIVNWAYDPDLYPSGEGRSSHLDQIVNAHDLLASGSNLGEIEVSKMWERARSENPSIKLTSDGNHPSAAGSYLVALAIYSKLSGRSVTSLDYAPQELARSDADALRQVVDNLR
jgi:hypothetical protein